MRPTIVATLAAAVLTTACAGGAAAGPTSSDAIDSAVRGARSRFEIPGISVAVMLGGQLVYAKGFGLADGGAAANSIVIGMGDLHRDARRMPGAPSPK